MNSTQNMIVVNDARLGHNKLLSMKSLRSPRTVFRGGFTLTEIVVVVMIVGFFAFLIISCENRGFKILAKNTKCANNLKGIATAWIANCQDPASISAWTNTAKRKLSGNGRLTFDSLTDKRITPDQSSAMTAAIFEVWCAGDRANIPTSLFQCPAVTSELDRPDSSLLVSAERPDTSWGWNSKHSVSYAFDYSASCDEHSSNNAASCRVILADRNPLNHKNKILVCYADTHTGTIKWQQSSSGHAGVVPENTVGRTLTRNGYLDAVAINTEINDPESPSDPPDNIFDNVGDITGTMKPGDEFQIGTGSPHRAFVK